MTDQAEVEKDQTERSRLREDYLRSLAAMSSKQVKIQMYENVCASAEFKSYHPDGTKVLVTNINIPRRVLPKTVMLRTSDIMSVTFYKEIVQV